MDLIGIVDADAGKAARLAAQYDSQAFTDHRELFGKVDVVSIAVPTPLHFEIAKECLEAGISVLVEKPLTSTLEEARDLFRIARERNVVLHVGHVERFNGAVQELRKIVANPILVESRRLGPFVPRVQHDTVVMDLMIHDVDIVLGLVDSEVRRITAAGARVHSARSDVANVQILFESGTVANITASRATEHKVRTLAITQPDAYIFLDYTDQDIQIHRRAASEYVLNRESIRYRQESFVEHLFVHKENPLKLEILHILKAVREAQRTGSGRAPRAGRRALARRGARDRAHDRGGSAAPRLAAPLSGMAEALGLVGGAGTLPVLMAREARRAGWRVVAFALAASEPLDPHADRVVPCRLGDVGPILSVARRGEDPARGAGRPGPEGRAVPGRAAGRGRAAAPVAKAADWSDDGLLGRGGAGARGDGHRGARPADVPGALAGARRPGRRAAGSPGARGRRGARASAGAGPGGARRGPDGRPACRLGGGGRGDGGNRRDRAPGPRPGGPRRGRGQVAGAARTTTGSTCPPSVRTRSTAARPAAQPCWRSQAGRVLLLDRERVEAEAARAGMSVVGVAERPGVD